MAFLDESVELTGVGKEIADHALLLGEGIHPSDRIIFLKGVVLAALLDDAELSKNEEIVVRRIAQGLELSDEIIAEALELKTELSGNPASQNEFLQELYSVLSTPVRKNCFVKDVEALFFEKGKLNPEVEKHYRRLCVNLFGQEWERDFEARQFSENHPVAGRISASLGRIARYAARTNLAYLIRKAVSK